jgi:uncharacterized protein
MSEQSALSFNVPLGEYPMEPRRKKKITERDPFGRELGTYEEDAWSEEARRAAARNRRRKSKKSEPYSPPDDFTFSDPEEAFSFGRPLETENDDALFVILGDAAPAKQSQTSVQLYDNIVIDDEAKVTFTDDGFLKAMPRIARTGIQIYGGDECGIPSLPNVRVYRPERAVFDAKAIHSYTHLPTTLEHPPTPVTPANWKDHATGETGDEVLRDGGTVRVPLMLRDAKAIAAWKDGSKKQLSVGYTCDLRWEPGVTDAGEPYDAVQDNIRANHLAQCAAARGGPILTIGDRTGERDMNAPALKTVMVDGIACEMTDTASQLVSKTIGRLTAIIDEFKKKDQDKDKECDDAVKKIGELTAVVATKDAEIATLKKGIEDAKLTPAQIDALVSERHRTFDKARAYFGDAVKFDGKSVEEVRRMVVDKHLGEVAKGWTDGQVQVSFDTIVAGIKTSSGGGPRVGTIDHAERVFAGRPHSPAVHYDTNGINPQAIRDAAYMESVREMSDAWKPQAVRDAEAAARKAMGN